MGGPGGSGGKRRTFRRTSKQTSSVLRLTWRSEKTTHRCGASQAGPGGAFHAKGCGAGSAEAAAAEEEARRSAVAEGGGESGAASTGEAGSAAFLRPRLGFAGGASALAEAAPDEDEAARARQRAEKGRG